MKWSIKRGSKNDWNTLNGKGFVISYELPDGRFIRSYPIAKKYCWPFYPYILYQSAKYVKEMKNAELRKS